MITPGERDSIVGILSTMLRAIDAHRGQIQFHDMGTDDESAARYGPALDLLLKRWRMDPVGAALRRGIREIGTIVAPRVAMEELVRIAENASHASQNADWSIAIFNRVWDRLVTSDGRMWCA